MNSFEIAVLRILVKNQRPVSKSFLVRGFPNNSEGFVLEAISGLSSSGYVSFIDDQGRYITYNKYKRKEILAIVDPIQFSSAVLNHNIKLGSENTGSCPENHGLTPRRNERERADLSSYEKPSLSLTSTGKIALVVATVFALGLVGIASYNLPTSSFDQNSNSDIRADYQRPQHQSNQFQSYSVNSIMGPTGTDEMHLKYAYYPVQCTGIESRDVHGHAFVLVIYRDLCILRSL